MVKAFPETSTSIRVSWQPPPENKRNGKIVYYKIFYVKSTRSDPEATMIEIEMHPAVREKRPHRKENNIQRQIAE